MKKTTAIFLLSLLFFCGLSFFRLGEAYIHMPHESRIAAWAVDWTSDSNHPMDVIRPMFMFFQGPTAMELPFAGNLTVVLSVISMIFLGPGLFALRCMYVLCSLLSLCCIFYVLSRWFDEWVGALAVLLLAVDPPFVLATRFGGERDEILQIFLLWAGLACIELSVSRRRKLLFYLSGFCFGLALWAKMMFLGYFFGLFGVLVLCGKQSREKLMLRYRLGLKDFVFFVGAFGMGSLPLIIYNFYPETFMLTFRMLFGSLFFGSMAGRDNLDVLMNIIERFEHLHTLAVQIAPYYKLYFVLPFICLFVGRTLILKRYFSRRIIAGIIWAYLICFLLSSFVPVASEPVQLLILWPVMQIVIALFVRVAYLDFSSRGWRPGMAAALFGALFVFGHCCHLYAFSASLTRDAFDMRKNIVLVTNDSRNLYYMSDFLQTRKERTVYCYSPEIPNAGSLIDEDIFMLSCHEITKPLEKDVLFLLWHLPGDSFAQEAVLNLSQYGRYFGPEYVDAELIYYSHDSGNDINGYIFRLSPVKQSPAP